MDARSLVKVAALWGAVLWALSSTVAFAEPEARSEPGRSVSGVVRDAVTGEPVVGVVLLTAGVDGEPRVASTDLEGRFVLRGLPEGPLTVELSGPTIVPAQVRVDAEAPGLGDRDGQGTVDAEVSRPEVRGGQEAREEPDLVIRVERESSLDAQESADETSTLEESATSQPAVASEPPGSATEALPEYRSVVRTARPSAPTRTASSVRISSRDLTAAPLRGAEDALRLVPGLTLVQHGSEGKGHQFFLRGFDALHGADLEVTLQGIPINEWSNIHAQGYLDLGIIIPEAIESVAVTKGPFTLEQGAFGMAGSADYRLGVPGEDRGLRLAGTVGSTGRYRALASYTPPDRGDRFVIVEALHEDGYGANRGLQRGALMAHAPLWGTRATGRLTALVAAQLATFELPGTLRNEDVDDGVVDFYGTYDDAGAGASGRALAGLSFDYENDGDRLLVTLHGGYRTLSLLESFTGFLIHPTEGDRRFQRHEVASLGLDAGYDRRLLEGLTLRTGLGLRAERFDQRQDHVGQGALAGASVQEGLLALPFETLGRERDLEGTQTLAHARAGLRWSVGRALTLDAGARLDVAHVSIFDALAAEVGGPEATVRGGGTLTALSPRLVAQWRPSPELRLFGAYGRGFRPPEARAFSAFTPERIGLGEERDPDGGPALTASDAFELGAHWAPTATFEGSLSAFATSLERESVFDHVAGVNLELNGTRRLGLELAVEARPLYWLTLAADATVVDARFVESGRPIPHAPWLQGGLRAVARHPRGWSAGLRFLAVAPRQLPHGARGSTLTSLDGTVGYRWRGLRLALELENLLFRRIREGEYHYASHWPQGGSRSELPVLHFVAGAPFNARLTVGAVF